MKKIIIIAAFAFVASFAAVSATGQLEVTVQSSQRQEQVRLERQRQEQLRLEQQRRDQWQRARWQSEQDQRKHRHERWESYRAWLRYHEHDYDNRGNDYDNRRSDNDNRGNDNDNRRND